TPEKQAPWALTSSSPTPGWAMVPCLGKTDRLGADRGLVAMIIRCLPTPGETSTRPNPRASSLFTARLIAALRPMTMIAGTYGWRPAAVSARAAGVVGALMIAGRRPAGAPAPWLGAGSVERRPAAAV